MWWLDKREVSFLYIRPPPADLSNCPAPKELDLSKLKGKTYLKEGVRNNERSYLWKSIFAVQLIGQAVETSTPETAASQNVGGRRPPPAVPGDVFSRRLLLNSISKDYTGWPPRTAPKRQPSPSPAQEFLIWFPSPRADTGLSFQVNSYFLRNEIWNQMKCFWKEPALPLGSPSLSSVWPGALAGVSALLGYFLVHLGMPSANCYFSKVF